MLAEKNEPRPASPRVVNPTTQTGDSSIEGYQPDCFFSMAEQQLRGVGDWKPAPDAGKTYTADDWNPTTRCKARNGDVPAGYRGSKKRPHLGMRSLQQGMYDVDTDMAQDVLDIDEMKSMKNTVGI